ncbi:MAG: alpha/beta hydrolase [Chloroflexi bacterium]|nr:alpha/beta hydrolase [Chloroflexota bacterium]
MKRAYVDVPEGQIHYQYEGNTGDAVICLHQGPLSSNEFSRLLPILGAKYRAIALDTLGYGKSDKVPPTYEVPDYAKSVFNVMKALDIPKASLIGSKMGATIAVDMAITQPGKVDKLVLHGLPGFDAETRQKCINSWRYSNKFTEIAVDGTHLLKIWEREKRWGKTAPPELWQMAVIDALTAGREAYQGYQAMFRYPEEAALPKIKAPTLLVTGPEDIFGQFAPSFQKLIPRSKIASIEKMEGLVFVMMPDVVGKIVMDFLANPGV